MEKQRELAYIGNGERQRELGREGKQQGGGGQESDIHESRSSEKGISLPCAVWGSNTL